jgi:hypothetical protein
VPELGALLMRGIHQLEIERYMRIIRQRKIVVKGYGLEKL